LYVDIHVSDGIDHQYDITFGYNGDSGAFSWSPHISQWLNQVYRPATEAALKAMGHIPGQFFEVSDEIDVAKGFSMGPSLPRFSGGYGDLRQLPTVLVETHSLKPYRQRVLGTYVLIEASLQTLGAVGNALQKAVADDMAAAPARVALNGGKNSGGRKTMDFLGVSYETYASPATGTNEIRWLGKPKLYSALPVTLEKPDLEVARPKAYWL